MEAVTITPPTAIHNIVLPDGSFAVVDAVDWPRLSVHKWYRYARGYVGNKKTYLHRAVLDAPADHSVDHIDGDRLNNRRCNLRLSTHRTNGYNRGKTKANTSGYKGVVWWPRDGNWKAQITVNYKCINLGYYPTAEEAAHAYDKAAKELHGEFARLNFPEDIP